VSPPERVILTPSPLSCGCSWPAAVNEKLTYLRKLLQLVLVVDVQMVVEIGAAQRGHAAERDEISHFVEWLATRFLQEPVSNLTTL
jgi:hypothetical protein